MEHGMNPLAHMLQSQIEASRKVAAAVLSGTEKLDRAMFGATRRALEDQLTLAQELAGARDPRNVGTTLRSALISKGPEDAAQYQKEVLEIFSEMQNDISRSLQEFMDSSRSAETEAASATVSSAERMRNPVAGMFSVWESAFKEAAALAQRNMSNAQSAVVQGMTAAQEAVSATADESGGRHGGSHGGSHGGGKRK